MERDISDFVIGNTVYQVLVDFYFVSFAILSIKITDICGPSKRHVKGLAKIIWTNGNTNSISNHLKLGGEERMFLPSNLLLTLDECLEELKKQQDIAIQKMEDKKKDLVVEIADLKVMMEESKAELKKLNSDLNKRINKLKNLDVKTDLMNRGIIEYE